MIKISTKDYWAIRDLLRAEVGFTPFFPCDWGEFLSLCNSVGMENDDVLQLIGNERIQFPVLRLTHKSDVLVEKIDQLDNLLKETAHDIASHVGRNKFLLQRRQATFVEISPALIHSSIIATPLTANLINQVFQQLDRWIVAQLSPTTHPSFPSLTTFELAATGRAGIFNLLKVVADMDRAQIIKEAQAQPAPWPPPR